MHLEALNVTFDNSNSDPSKGSTYKKLIILKKALYNY